MQTNFAIDLNPIQSPRGDAARLMLQRTGSGARLMLQRTGSDVHNNSPKGPCRTNSLLTGLVCSTKPLPIPTDVPIVSNPVQNTQHSKGDNGSQRRQSPSGLRGERQIGLNQRHGRVGCPNHSLFVHFICLPVQKSGLCPLPLPCSSCVDSDPCLFV